MALLLLTAGFTAGCVPYQTYQQTKNELEKAQVANADLVKRYNDAIQKLMLKDKAGASTADYQALLADNERLKRELQNRGVRPAFTDEEMARLKQGGGKEEEGGVALGDALLFSEGSADLRREAFPILDEILRLLKTKYSGDMVIIEGHTDNQPVQKVIRLYPENMTLGFYRAHAVFKYFHDKGVPESRIVVHSYSFNKPLDPEKIDTKEGRRENRRVVVRLGGSQI